MTKNNQRLDRLKKIAHVLDNQFQGPLGYRFGLDPVIGLIPFFGDLVMTGYSFFIVLTAARMGCGSAVLIRMVLNVGLESFIQKVPLLGSIFDFFWKANIRNTALLEAYVTEPAKTRGRSNLVVGLILTSLVIILCTGFYFSFVALRSLYSILTR